MILYNCFEIDYKRESKSNRKKQIVCQKVDQRKTQIRARDVEGPFV
jgi:hypothetical protein